MGVTAIFGFVTLMGMIMRNEILIFEHAKGLMRQGFSAREAAYDAGKLTRGDLQACVKRILEMELRFAD